MSIPLVQEIAAGLLLVTAQVLAEAVQRCGQCVLVEQMPGPLLGQSQLFLAVPQDAYVLSLSHPDIRQFLAFAQIFQSIRRQLERDHPGGFTAQAPGLVQGAPRLGYILYVLEGLEFDVCHFSLDPSSVRT